MTGPKSKVIIGGLDALHSMGSTGAANTNSGLGAGGSGSGANVGRQYSKSHNTKIGSQGSGEKIYNI